VVQLLDDILLPKSATSMGRAKGLIFIWRFLDNSSKEAFRRIMQERAKFLKIWHAFVLMKSASKKQQAKKKSASTQLDDKEFAEKEKNVLEEFKLLVPETENPKRLVDQLYAWKDQSVFKHMETLCDQKASTDHIRHARDQLIKCVGSKTALGEYLKNVCRKLNLLTINQESIQCFVQVLQSCFSRGNKNFIATSRESKQSRTICLDILSICAKTLPELLHEPVKKLFGKVLEAATQEDTPESDDDEEPIDSDDSVTQVRRGKRECSPRTNNEKKQMVLGILRILAHYAKFMRKLREDTQNDEETFDFVSMDEDSKLLRILQDFCMTGKSHTNGSMASSQEAAKLAALCYPQLLEVESKKANSLIEKLCQKKSLVVIVPKKTKNRQAQALVGMPQVRSLQSLVKLTKYCSSSFERYSNTLWETLQEEYLGETGVGSSGGMSPVVIAELRCLAIQVAVNLQTLCAIPDNELDLESEAVVKERNEFLKQLLFDLLRSDGKKFTSNAQLALKYRMVAACGLLRMVRQSKFEALMNISNWHLLGFVMQDSEEQVRSSFLRKLTSYLMKKNVPNPQKYMSFLTLAANEPEMRLKKQAKQLLQMSVQRMRKKFELASASKSVALTGVEEDETEDSRQNRNALMVPEYSLPYVIHLLAHHPDCPAPQTANRISGSNTFLNSVWAEQMQYLSFFLDGLISSHAVEVNNIAFLLQICTKMSECHDPTVTNSMKEQKIYPLIDGTVALLKKRIKNISNLKSFPGRIYLPKQLYVIGRAESKTPSKASSNSKTSTSSHETLVSDKKKIPRISVSCLRLLQLIFIYVLTLFPNAHRLLYPQLRYQGP
jgi:sister-chromatid-cohesion protein PDS5